MIAGRPRSPSIAFVFTLAGLGSIACHAKDDAFYERVFPCDPAAPQADCGTSRNGEPLACYDARQLGGQSVCTELCGAGEVEGPHGGYACLASGVRLKTCDPTASEDDSTLGCPAGLNCLRTELLLRQEGLCMAVPLCAEDSDCSSTTKRRCAGALIRDIYGAEVPLATDHLQCVQDHCLTTLTGCESGETCVAKLGLTPLNFPDICVPDCDADLNCPPNFVCSRKVSGPGAPLVCVPGLPGNRCTSSLDCIVGDCVDSGEGFNICAIPCQTHQNCVPLINGYETFMCVPNLDGDGKHCATESPFSGSPCQQPADCPDGTDCFFYSPYGSFSFGECRPPCDATGHCRVRGGIPNVCLEGGAGGCYPGRFGLPCQDDAECMVNFSCSAVPEDPDVGRSAASVCTVPCETDANCDDDPWTLKIGYCAAGFCRLGGGDGDPCLRDQHCRTRRCDLPPGGGPGTCLPNAAQ